MRIHQILSGNYLSYAVALNDLCYLEIEVKVTQFELGPCLLWCSCVPYLVRIDQIFLQILSGNHLSHADALNNLCEVEIDVKFTRFELGLWLALVLLCTKFDENTSNIS